MWLSFCVLLLFTLHLHYCLLLLSCLQCFVNMYFYFEWTFIVILKIISWKKYFPWHDSLLIKVHNRCLKYRYNYVYVLANFNFFEYRCYTTGDDGVSRVILVWLWPTLMIFTCLWPTLMIFNRLWPTLMTFTRLWPTMMTFTRLWPTMMIQHSLCIYMFLITTGHLSPRFLQYLMCLAHYVL